VIALEDFSVFNKYSNISSREVAKFSRDFIIADKYIK
jgi:hypothetical protein